MKKYLFVILVSFTLIFPRCAALKNLGIIPSELEMVAGLKEALTQGLFKSFNAFADPNGNPLVRFVFPGDAVKIEKTLKDLGLDRTVNQLTAKFTRAMSSAVSASKPIFLQAVKDMSIRDAVNILVTDNTHAATDYFKQAMQPSLIVAFRPIVDSTIRIEGADREWTSITSVYNSIPFISKPLESNLTDFISARVVDLMFFMVANEEEQIRTKYELRKTDLLKKVFNYAEQELKRRRNRF
jgi:hypothetical protein